MSANILNIIVLVLLSAVLLISSYTDLKYRKIYDVVTVSAIIAIVLVRIFHHPQGVVMYLWGVVPAVIFYLAAVLSKGKGVGGGDIKLLLFLGLTIGGIGTVMTVVYACVLALLFSAVAYVIANTKVQKIPLAPFFMLGAGIFYLQPHWLVPLIS